MDIWQVTENIIACGFDTTLSNTGVYNETCTLMQQLWLADNLAGLSLPYPGTGSWSTLQASFWWHKLP